MAFPGKVEVEITGRNDQFVNMLRNSQGELKKLDRDARSLDLSSRFEQGSSSVKTFASSAQRASVDVKGLTLSMVGLGTTFIGIAAASSRLDFALNRVQKTQVAVKRINDQIASTQKNLNRLIDQGKTNTEDYRVQLGRLETAFDDQKTKIEDVNLAQTALNDTQLLFATTIVNTAINSIFLMRSAFRGLSIAQIRATLTSRTFTASTNLSSVANVGAAATTRGLTVAVTTLGRALKVAFLPLIAITAAFAAYEGLLAPFIKEQTGVNVSILDWTDSMLQGKTAVEETNTVLQEYQRHAKEAGEATGDITSELDTLFGLVGKPNNNPMVEFWRRARIEALVPYLATLKQINVEQVKAGLATGVIPSLGGGSASVTTGGVSVTGSGTVTARSTSTTQTSTAVERQQQEFLVQSFNNATPTTQRALVAAVESGIKFSRGGPLSKTQEVLRRLGLFTGTFSVSDLNSENEIKFELVNALSKRITIPGLIGPRQIPGSGTVTGTSVQTEARLNKLFQLAATDPLVAGILFPSDPFGATRGKQSFITGQQISQGTLFGDDDIFDPLLVGRNDAERAEILRRIDKTRRETRGTGFGKNVSPSVAFSQQFGGLGGQAAIALASIPGGNANNLIGGASQFADRNRQTLRDNASEAKARDAITNSLAGAISLVTNNNLVLARNFLLQATGSRQRRNRTGSLGRSQADALRRSGGIDSRVLEDARFEVISGIAQLDQLVGFQPGRTGDITRRFEKLFGQTSEFIGAAVGRFFELRVLGANADAGLTQKQTLLALKKALPGGFPGLGALPSASAGLARLQEFVGRVTRGQPITVQQAEAFAPIFLGQERLDSTLVTLGSSVKTEFLRDNIDTRNEVLELEARAYFIEREERSSIA